MSADFAHLQDIAVAIDDGIAVVTLDRPPVNALRTQTLEELLSVFTVLRDRPDCIVIVLRSALDGIFSAGADINELPMTPKSDRLRQRLAHEVLDAILEAAQPVIAAINGHALGGGAALAACADIRIAARNATLGVPEITVGRCGGSRHLMRILPQGEVRLAYFTAQPLSAQDAYRLGAFQRLVEAEELSSAAIELARTISRHSPTALQLAKEALNLAETLPIGTGYRVEQQFSLRLATTADAQEGAVAFREKRAPVWGQPDRPEPLSPGE